MSKKKYRLLNDSAAVRHKTKHALMNKYYNLFMNSMEVEGLDKWAKDFVMKKFWSKGTIAAFNLKNVGLAFADYSTGIYGLYDVPVSLNLINERNVPGFPVNMLTVDVNTVIGYYQKNHKPVKEMVEYYVDRMVEVLMSINTNVQVSKVPFLIGVDAEDEDSANEVIEKIINDDLAIFMKSEMVNSIKSLSSGANYIVDKLWDHYLALEGQLLTYLGVDNCGNQSDYHYNNIDDTNSNNNLINSNADGYESELTDFADKVSEVLGYSISFKTKFKPAKSEYNESGEVLEDANE